MTPKFSLALCAFALVAFAAGCESEIRDVPPSYVGRLLTTTGWADNILTPGQANIGKLDTSGRGSTLVLIQTSAFSVEESFIRKGENTEDHRVLTSDQSPVSLDIRFLFTSPDIANQKGAEDVKRLFTLGNPSQKGNRVMEISLESIYAEQAKLQVRGKIRDCVGQFKDFDDIFQHRDKLNTTVRKLLSEVLADRNVPLVLVDCQVSNIAPDPQVRDNQIKLQAAQAEIDSMKKLQVYLDQNPSARLIFVLGKLKEIASIASQRGNNTIILSSDLGDLKALPLLPVKPQPAEKP